MCLDTSLLDQEIYERIRDCLTSRRVSHSVRVATLARELCGRFGIDPAAGFTAGLAHDMCKGESSERLLALASMDGGEITAIERNKPALLHGRAAAMVLRSDYGLKEGAITNAVRHHTFGDPKLEPLGLVLYVADKIEAGRKQVLPAFRLRVLASDLKTMAYLVLEDNLRYLESKGKKVSAVSREMFDRLKEG